MTGPAWVFVLLLNLPSFGGSVTATVTATSWDACEKLRRMVLGQVGGEGNINGTITRCTAATVPPPLPDPPDPPS